MQTMTSQVSAPAVVDHAALFRYSGLLDALRDALGVMLDIDVDASAARDAVNQYNNLREQLLGVLDDQGIVEITTWSVPLDIDAPLHRTYLACVSLARLMDLIHQTPEFLLAQQVRQANVEELQVQMTSSRPGRLPEPSTLGFGFGIELERGQDS